MKNRCWFRKHRWIKIADKTYKTTLTYKCLVCGKISKRVLCGTAAG